MRPGRPSPDEVPPALREDIRRSAAVGAEVIGGGRARRGAAAGHGDELAEMAGSWPFFADVLSNVEMVLAETDLDIASRDVDTLVPDEHRRLLEVIRVEQEKTCAEVLAVLGVDEPLGGRPGLRRTLARRGATLTINGIANGLRTTGWGRHDGPGT